MKALTLFLGYFFFNKFLLCLEFEKSTLEFIRSLEKKFARKEPTELISTYYQNSKTGNYVPINQGKLNKFVVEKNLILLRNKKRWIEENRKKVSKKFLSQNKIRLRNLKESLEQLNLLKRNHWLEKDSIKQRRIKKRVFK